MTRAFALPIALALAAGACGGRPAPSTPTVASASPPTGPAVAPSEASAAAAPPVTPQPPPPDPARCNNPIDPPQESWPELEGCRVTFKTAMVEAALACTQMLCGAERPCCNSCSAGTVQLQIGRTRANATRGGKPVLCKSGRNCEVSHNCELPPGPAFVTGVLSKGAQAWSFDVEEFEHRVGSCSLLESATRATEHSASDICEGTYVCDDHTQGRVSCDGENDKTHSSICECEIDWHKIKLGKTVPGESPDSCDGALVACLAASKRSTPSSKKR